MDLKGVILPADVEWYFAGRQLGTYVVQGDCLGGMKVPDKSTLVIDLDMGPAIGCITVCEVEGEQELYAKMYLGPSCKGPGKHLVRTYYTDSSRDQSFLASRVQGVAIACFDEKGSLLWRRPTDEEIKNNHLSINTREGWIRACRESAIKHLKEQGIEPTDENIAGYQKELKERVDEAVDELIAKQAAASQGTAA